MPVLGLLAAQAQRRPRQTRPRLELLETRELLSRAETAISDTLSAARAGGTSASQTASLSPRIHDQHPLIDAATQGSVGRAPRFYSHFRGPRRPDLHVLTARGQFFPPQGFAFTGVTVGSINTSQTSFYVFGVNRGGASAPGPFPDRPNITFDAEVVVATGTFGFEATVELLNSKGQVTNSVSLPESAITFSKTHVGVFVPADLLPSTAPPGTAKPVEDYSFAFWAGTSPSAPRQIAGFSPEFANASFELKSIPAS
jgi:hypothetical protein